MTQKTKLQTPLAFLGAGNMAEALIRGLLLAKIITPKKIFAADPNVQRLAFVRRKYKISSGVNNLTLVRVAPVLILAVKPQNMEQLGQEIRGEISEKHLLISIAAGVTSQALRRHFGPKPRLIRVMPNTPALVGAGATAICPITGAKKSDVGLTSRIFGAVGTVTMINDEETMHQITALSGSGPAYVFYFLESMISAGIKAGLDEDTARTLSLQTLIGSAKLLAESGEDPRSLRQKVSSPGGTTVAGIQALEQGQFFQNVENAVQRASYRSRELAKEG